MRLIRVEPECAREAMAFVTRSDGACGLGRVSVPVYPIQERARALKMLRLKEPYLPLHLAARALEFSGVELSELETGRLRFENDADFTEAIRRLMRAKDEAR